MANGGIIFISIDDRTCNVVVRHCGQLIWRSSLCRAWCKKSMHWLLLPYSSLHLDQGCENALTSTAYHQPEHLSIVACFLKITIVAWKSRSFLASSPHSMKTIFNRSLSEITTRRILVKLVLKTGYTVYHVRVLNANIAAVSSEFLFPQLVECETHPGRNPYC